MPLTPFCDNGHLTSEQKKKIQWSPQFNQSGHWTFFKFVKRQIQTVKISRYEKGWSTISGVVVTCCVLHNFILMTEIESVNESESEISEESWKPFRHWKVQRNNEFIGIDYCTCKVCVGISILNVLTFTEQIASNFHPHVWYALAFCSLTWGEKMR